MAMYFLNSLGNSLMEFLECNFPKACLDNTIYTQKDGQVPANLLASFNLSTVNKLI